MNRKTAPSLLVSVCLLTTLLPNVFATSQTGKAVQVQSQICGVVDDPVGDVTTVDATSPDFDIVKVSFSFSQGTLAIDFEVSRKITQGGYFVLFDTDQNTSTGCDGYREMDGLIGTDYFIHFDPISVPAAQLCSSYRPWVRIRGLQYVVNESVVTFYLALSDIGLSGNLIKFDVVARTFLHLDYRLYRDRAPDMGIFTITIATAVTAAVDIYPDTLNLKSKGKWITALVRLPEGYNARDIDISSIRLNDTIPAEPKPHRIRAHENGCSSILVVKFDRAAVSAYIRSRVKNQGRFAVITLTVTGELENGTSFQGSDTIKAIFPMRKVKPRCERFVEFPIYACAS